MKWYSVSGTFVGSIEENHWLKRSLRFTYQCVKQSDEHHGPAFQLYLHATRNLLSCNLYKSTNILQTVAQTVAQPEWGRRGHGPRGVTRLDGARGKKQVWRPHVTTWSLLQAKVLHWRKYLWHYFRGPRSDLVPPSWFGARVIVPPLVSLRYAHAWLPRYNW